MHEYLWVATLLLIACVSKTRSFRPNWRDAAAYMPLIEADRSMIAWEWLRRDRSYLAAIDAEANWPNLQFGTNGPARFGLVAFEPPHLAVPVARPVWNSSVHPFVLFAARAGGPDTSDLFDFARFGELGRLVVADRREHLLFSDGLSTIRLDGPSGTFSNGPVHLCFSFRGLASAEAPLLTIRRLIALVRTGGFSRSLHNVQHRAARWILILRTADALAQGATQREIAYGLFGRQTGEARWRSRDPSLKSRAQRLVRSARCFSAGEYRSLLR